MCIYARVTFTVPMGLPPSAPLPGLPPYYSNVFTGHALLSMPVNCLVNIWKFSLPVAVQKVTFWKIIYSKKNMNLKSNLIVVIY